MHRVADLLSFIHRVADPRTLMHRVANLLNFIQLTLKRQKVETLTHFANLC